MTKQIAHKGLSWLLAAALFAFPACGSNESTDKDIPSEEVDTTGVPSDVPPVEEPGKDDPTPPAALGDGEVPGTGADGDGDLAGVLPGAAPEALSDDASASARGSSSGSSSSFVPEPPGPDPILLPEPQPTPEPGQLTAGVWDDNQNFDRFSAYRLNPFGATNVPEMFAEDIPEGTSVSTDEEGFPDPIPVSLGLPFTEAEHLAAFNKFSGGRTAKAKLDIVLVIDTTGSMGDELTYLQTEFDAISTSISQQYPNAEQRWSLVVYRDETDEYVTRWFDFRDDLDDFRARLAEQGPSGGGDYPEASHAALETMNQLAWRPDEDVARLAFWVADAPHHDQHVDTLAWAVRTAAEQDIHIYPVASSGVDDLTEFSMRSSAQLTGGRYIFLTEDSGIGEAKKEPNIPCYFVTRLDHAILRMVAVEMSGSYIEPDPANVIRTGGNPQDGACTLASGTSVGVF